MNYITSLLLLSSNTFLHPTTTYLQSMNDSIVLVTSSVSTELTTLGYDPISTISGVNGTNNIDYIKLLNDTNSTFVQLDNSETEIDDSSSNSEDVSSNDEQIALMNSSSDFSDESDEGNDSDDNGDEVENMENNQANESDTQNEDDRVLNYDTSSSENENGNENESQLEQEHQHYYYKNRLKFYNHFLRYPEMAINNNDDRAELASTKNDLLVRLPKLNNRRLTGSSRKKTLKSKSKSKSSKLKHKSRKSHKRRPKLLKSKNVETNEITTVEVITLTITKVLARHDLAAIVTPIQQHQSGHLIIGYPLPIATKSRLHDYYKSSGVLKEVDANPTEEYDSGDGKENTQQNPIPEKMRLPTNDDPYSLKPTHHYDPSATMQNPHKQFTNRTGNFEIPTNVQDIDDITFPIDLSSLDSTLNLYSILPINQTNLPDVNTLSLAPGTGSVPPRYSNHHSEFTVERPPRPSRTKKRPRIKAKKTMKVSTQISSAMSKSIHITRIGSTSSGIASGITNIVIPNSSSSIYDNYQDSSSDKQPVSLSMPTKTITMTTDTTSEPVTITEKLDKPKFPDIFTIIRSKLLSKKPQETKLHSPTSTGARSSKLMSSSSSNNNKPEISKTTKEYNQTQENTLYNTTKAVPKTSVVSSTTSTKPNDQGNNILNSFIQFTETIHSRIRFPTADDNNNNAGNNYHRRFTGVVLPENRQFIFRSASQNLSFPVLGLIVLLLLLPGLLIIIM